MKKILCLIVFLAFLSSCTNCKYEVTHIEIGKSSFDGEVITFYDEQVRRADQLISSHLYYKVGFSNSQNDGTLLSKDGNFKLFVDFDGEQEVFDAFGSVIEPNDCFQYENRDINIFILNAGETYYELTKGLNDYSFIYSQETCHEAECRVSVALSLETVKAEIERWTKLDDCQDYASPEAFMVFFEIAKNQREVGESPRYWLFGKVELDDGRWVVFIMEDERVYYLLDVNQVESFKKMIGI